MVYMSKKHEKPRTSACKVNWFLLTYGPKWAVLEAVIYEGMAGLMKAQDPTYTNEQMYSAQFCASVHIGQTWNLSRHILKKRMPTVGRYTPSFPVLFRLGLGKTTVFQFRIHVQFKCASVSWKVWFSLHTQTRFFFKKKSSVISGRFRKPWFHLVSVPAVHSQHSLSGKHESWGPRRAKAKVGSDESGQSGRKVTYEILMISYDILFFTLLVSPWYMYKGSCFRDVCADAGVVGGYLRGSTGVHTYIYISISILYHSISFFRGQVKRVLSAKHALSMNVQVSLNTLEVQGYFE